MEIGADLRQEKAANLYNLIGSQLASVARWNSSGACIALPLLCFDGLEQLLMSELRMEWPRIPDMPSLPPNLKPWLEGSLLGDPDLGFPELMESAVMQGETPVGKGPGSHEVYFLSDFPDLRVARARYIDEVWAPWAMEARRVKEELQRYSMLSHMHMQVLSLLGSYEVVLSWGRLNGRPIGLFPVSIRREGTGDTLVAALDTENPCDSKVEAYLGLGTDHGDGALRELGDFISSKQEEVLGKGKVNWCAPEGLQPGKCGLVPEPALVLRKRAGSTLWTLGGMCAGKVLGERRIPLPVLDLLVGKVSSPVNPPVPEVVIPLPANPEQRDAVVRLTRGKSMAVAAPRGSGSTLTVVNAASALMGLGKRVLVCAPRMEDVMEILGMFPSGLAGLAVADPRDAQDSGSGLAAGIRARENDLRVRFEGSPGTVGPFLDKAAREYSVLLSATSDRISGLKEWWTTKGSPDDGADAMGGAIKDLASREEEEGWLPFIPKSKEPCPLNPSEGYELFGLMLGYSGRPPIHAKVILPDVGKLPTPQEFEGILTNLSAMETELGMNGDCESTDWVHEDAGEEAIGAAIQALASVLDRHEALSSSSVPWIRECTSDLLEGRRTKWAELWASTRRYVREIEAYPRRVLNSEVTGVEGLDPEHLRTDVMDFKNYLTSGGSLGFSVFRNRVVKEWEYIIEGITIETRPCTTASSLEELLRWVESQILLKRLADYWRLYAMVGQGSPQEQIQGHKERLALLDEGMNLDSARQTAMALCSGLAKPGHLPPRDPRECLTAMRSVRIGTKRRKLYEALMSLGERAVGHQPLVGAINSKDALGYAKALEDIRKEQEVLTDLKRKDFLLSRLGGSKGAQLLEFFDTKACAGDPGLWEGRFKAIGKAWAWAKEYGILLEESGGMDLLTLGDDLKAGLEKERASAQELSASLAWMAARGSEEKVRCVVACMDQLPALIEADEHFDQILVDAGHRIGLEGLFINVLGDCVGVFGDPWESAVPGIPPGIWDGKEGFPAGIHASNMITDNPSYFRIASRLWGVGTSLDSVYTGGVGLGDLRARTSESEIRESALSVGGSVSFSIVNIPVEGSEDAIRTALKVITHNCREWVTKGLTVGISGLGQVDIPGFYEGLAGAVGCGIMESLGLVSLDGEVITGIKRDIMIAILPGTKSAIYSLASGTKERLINLYLPAMEEIREILQVSQASSVYPEGTPEAIVFKEMGTYLSKLGYTVAEGPRTGNRPAHLRVAGSGGKEGWVVLTGIGPFPEDWLLDACGDRVPILLLSTAHLALKGDKAMEFVGFWLRERGIDPGDCSGSAIPFPLKGMDAAGKDMAGFLRLFSSQGYDTIDRRDTDGFLWIVGGRGLAKVMDEVSKAGLQFRYAPGGSSDTGFRDAWRMV